MISGVLVVDKEEGLTSRRVVDLARRALGERKAGHLGTLDPFATGILPICLGKATRLARFLSGGSKSYEGVIRLGATSDTMDRTGRVLDEGEVPPGLDREAIDRQLDRLRGEIEQIPPMYSAVQVNGRRLYRLARQGIEVERKPRSVTIHCFEVTSLALPRVSFRVRCSPGTYIRALVHDLGRALGCGALLDELRRTGAAPFTLEQAVPQAALEDPGRRKEVRERMIPLHTVDLGLPRLTIDRRAVDLVAHGRAVPLPPESGIPPAPPGEARHICLHRPDGGLAAVARLENGDRPLARPVVVLVPDSE